MSGIDKQLLVEQNISLIEVIEHLNLKEGVFTQQDKIVEHIDGILNLLDYISDH